VQLPKIGEWGFASGPNSDRYVFRRGRIEKAAKGDKEHSHRHMTWETEHIEGDGELPINCEKGSAAYLWWMRKLRQALVECCGLSKSAASKYGTHSLKRGGNTALFLAKAPKQHRVRAGGWKDEDMDDEYLQFLIEEELKHAAACSI
jgi:hypothetical protein